MIENRPVNKQRNRALTALKLVDKFVWGKGLERAPRTIETPYLFGKPIRNPIGLAAGVDKDGEMVNALSLFGFGFIEVGSVTWQPQKGNIEPNIYKLEDTVGYYNTMGCPSKGSAEVWDNLRNKRRWKGGLVGINISPPKTDDVVKAREHCYYCFDFVAELADYVTINVSCPNLDRRINWLEGDNLKDLLVTMRNAQRYCHKHVPIAVKFAVTDQNFPWKRVIELLCKYDMNGIIVGNTWQGYSGEYIARNALLNLEEVGKIAQDTDLSVISAGGISKGWHVQSRLDLGAHAVQILSSFAHFGVRHVRNMVDQTNKITLDALEKESCG